VELSVGVLTFVAFVVHALRRRTSPLVDLRLLRRAGLAASAATSFLLGASLFGSLFLFPLYHQLLRGQDAMMAGLLLAPQGIGAMLSMPIAGKLTDKMGPGRFVLTGIILIAAGMAVFTQISATTPYALILGSLVVMGLGMGMTMMPIMSAALASLTHHEVARGSTLMNIIQQSAGSVGTAVMSVILTNATLGRPSAALYSFGLQSGEMVGPDGTPLTPQQIGAGQAGLADAFGQTFWVALALIVLCLVPSLFLPRRKPETALEEGAVDGTTDGAVDGSVDGSVGGTAAGEGAAPALPLH
jgi:MFS family permease